MNTNCEFVRFTPANEFVKLHWAITGLLSRTYDAKWAYSAWLDGGSIDVYFANQRKSFYLVPGDYKAIWVDTRPAIMKENGDKPLIFWSSIISPEFIQRHMEDPDYDKNLATLYLSVLMTLKQDHYFLSMNPRVWLTYTSMYPGLAPEDSCDCEDCQEERKEKEIDALILPIVNLLRKRIRENTQEEKKQEGESCGCARDEFCGCELPTPRDKEDIFTQFSFFNRL